MNPSNETAWKNKGISLKKHGLYNKTLNAIDNDPDDDFIWVESSSLLSELGKYQQAVRSYDKALESNPNNETA